MINKLNSLHQNALDIRQELLELSKVTSTRITDIRKMPMVGARRITGFKDDNMLYYDSTSFTRKSMKTSVAFRVMSTEDICKLLKAFHTDQN